MSPSPFTIRHWLLATRYLLLSIVSNSNLPSSQLTTKPRRFPSTNIANAFGFSLPNKTSRHLNSPASVTSAR
jgi:hypothetical protein